jgi:sugar phosphate isomerase/epimerase
MRFGVCARDIGYAQEAIASGFDYAEFGAGYVLDHAKEIRDAWIPAPRTNLFFPGEVRLFIQPSPFEEIARARIAAAASIGTEVMVIGSGGARRAPEDEVDATVDWDVEFVKIVAAVQTIADEYSIRVAPESLNRKETNVGTRLARLAPLLVERGLAFTADSYHMLLEEEDWDEAIPVAPQHVHISNRNRSAPSPTDEELIPFVQRLQALGYDGTVTIEGRVENLAQAAIDLRQLFTE